MFEVSCNNRNFHMHRRVQILITSFQLVAVYLSNIYVFTNCLDTFLNIRTGSVSVQPADNVSTTLVVVTDDTCLLLVDEPTTGSFLGFARTMVTHDSKSSFMKFFG